jgi:DNA-binding response OmpR family regulator
MNQTSNHTLLHVEDDPNDVLLLQRAFRKAGITINIQSVSDGDKAVAYLSGTDGFAERDKFPLPTLVMLDLKMPRKSGLEVLQWIRSEAKLKRLVVVVFTSSRHDEDVNRAYDLGANSYLVKPVGFDQLVEVAKTIHQYWLVTNERAQGL